MALKRGEPNPRFQPLWRYTRDCKTGLWLLYETLITDNSRLLSAIETRGDPEDSALLGSPRLSKHKTPYKL